MKPDLSDRTALVTGAGRGIGRAIARALAACRARVALAARTQGQIDAVTAEIVSAGGRAVAVRMDVSDEEDVTAEIECPEPLMSRAAVELDACSSPARSRVKVEPDTE